MKHLNHTDMEAQRKWAVEILAPPPGCGGGWDGFRGWSLRSTPGYCLATLRVGGRQGIVVLSHSMKDFRGFPALRQRYWKLPVIVGIRRRDATRGFGLAGKGSGRGIGIF